MKLHEKVVEARMRILGEKHRDTIKSHRHLAEILQVLGRSNNASKLEALSFEDLEPEHDSTQNVPENTKWDAHSHVVVVQSGSTTGEIAAHNPHLETIQRLCRNP